MSPDENDKPEGEAVTEEKPAEAPAVIVPDAPAPEAPPEAPKLAAHAKTRFPKLPVLTEVDFKRLRMRPQDIAAYKAAKKHEDNWGHLPPQVHKHLVGVDPKNVAKNAVELHAKTRATDPVHFAATKAYFKWAMHQEMTLAEYDKAIVECLSARHSY